MLMILGLFSALFAGAAADTMLSLRPDADQDDTDNASTEDDESMGGDQDGGLLSFAFSPLEMPQPADDPSSTFDAQADRIHSSDAYPETPPPQSVIATGDASGSDMNGGGMDDRLTGGSVETRLAGHGGNDILTAGTGPTHQIGGEGDDVLVGGAGDDRLEGCEGDDILIAGLGDNTLMGGAGNDILVGAALDDDGNDQSGQNFLNGGAGDDILIAGSGDYLHGGDGADTFVLGQWLQGGDPVSLVDYHADEDQILLQYDPLRVPEPDLEIRFGSDMPETAEIWLNGQLIAQVANAPDLTVADVGIVPMAGTSIGAYAS